MINELSITFAGEKMVVNHLKTVYIPKKRQLLVSDIHLGKLSHFRKEGIGIPNALEEKNFERLAELIEHYKPKEVLILGDLFHSVYNSSWQLFDRFCNDFDTITFVLIKGNHDIIKASHYESISNLVAYNQWLNNGFLYTHEPLEAPTTPNICGHIHPGVKIKAKGLPAIKASCFYLTENQFILPAFGVFTGAMTLKPKENDQVIAVIENELVRLG